MAIYVRPTKGLCVLTVCVILFAVASVTYISFALAQELGVRAVQQHIMELHQ